MHLPYHLSCSNNCIGKLTTQQYPLTVLITSTNFTQKWFNKCFAQIGHLGFLYSSVTILTGYKYYTREPVWQQNTPVISAQNIVSLWSKLYILRLSHVLWHPLRGKQHINIFAYKILISSLDTRIIQLVKLLYISLDSCNTIRNRINSHHMLPSAVRTLTSQLKCVSLKAFNLEFVIIIHRWHFLDLELSSLI